MTTEERLCDMENSIEKIDGKLDEVLACLKGNDMGTVGLVKEFAILKAKVYDMDNSRSKEKAKSDIYMGIIKWLAAIIGALVITYMFSQAYNSK